MLGIREKDIYGKYTYDDLIKYICGYCENKDIYVEFYQSNHEGAIVDKIQCAYCVFDGIIINPAAYTHTSIAILDALKAVSIPAVEVHISNTLTREDFRKISLTSLACIDVVQGRGYEGYIMATELLQKHISKKNSFDRIDD